MSFQLVSELVRGPWAIDELTAYQYLPMVSAFLSGTSSHIPRLNAISDEYSNNHNEEEEKVILVFSFLLLVVVC